MILGIDEAGRGPVIGPMVMAGILINESDEIKLKELEITDSKLVNKKKRKIIYDIITKQFKHQIELITPEQIDDKSKYNLNDLEAITIAKLIYSLKPTIVYADCPSINPKSFNEQLLKILKEMSKDDKDFLIPKIVCEHKADINYISSSAASILAKVKRDEIIEGYKKEYNIDCGSGYPADKYTVEFLKNNINDPKLRKIIRMSWGTSKKLLNPDKEIQNKLIL
ncbi:ribonuclease HII [Candidatus Woesearchaeota archaeon]|jgi:ribonuclease HII|nr:ribonuclease HII [Candidatus Woesearchaeota archaeon]MBT4387101.1 ribonuclease HII [Candidatus Woesearchaeota archaeon]MBT4596142.1 ribonuclease HII [Candidatus Woesearchaeota archaeon]MBT5741635.1 ribonuclease HII [Candidatus Woesearchaeota archaeon]MBT6505656.1 ribonuclease HII [Candidatus Woesearchaeota archaeon]